MASKDYRYFFEDNPNIVAADNIFNDQFNNLNLNQGHQSLNANLIATNSAVTNDNKKVQNYDLTDNSQTQNRSISFGCSDKKLTSNFSNNSNYGFNKEEFKKEISSNSTNKSTLSLHIAAYENSIAPSSSADSMNPENKGLKKKDNSLIKKWKTTKQFFNGLISNIQNPFEFPRQQKEEDKINDSPEMMEFKASQKLFNPNKSAKNKIKAYPPPQFMASSSVKQNPLENIIFGDDVVISQYAENGLMGKDLPPLNFLPFNGEPGDPEEKADEALKKLAELEELKLKLNELNETIKNQNEIGSQQIETITKLRAPYLPVIKELEKLYNEEEKEPLAEYHKLIHHRESLIGGIELFKRDYERIKFRNKQEIKELQEEIAKAKERAAKKLEGKSTQSTNAIVQKQTSFNKNVSNNNPPVTEFRDEEDKEKAMLKSKILQKANILMKLINSKRIFTMNEYGFRQAINYGALDDTILIIDKLEYNTHQWLADGHLMKFDYEGFQICIKNEFCAESIDLSPILPRIFYSNIQKLSLSKILITFDEYKKLIESGKLDILEFQVVTVKDEDGNDMDVADLIKLLPNIRVFRYSIKDKEATPSQKLAALPPFSKLREFELVGIEEDFDLRVFAEFIIKNQLCDFCLKIFCSGEFYLQLLELAQTEVFPALPKPRANVGLQKCIS